VRRIALRGFLGQELPIRQPSSRMGTFLGVNELGKKRKKAPPLGKYSRIPIPDDEDGIRYEISRMIDFAQEFSGDPRLREPATRIISKCRARNQKCEVNALYKWVCKNTRFVQDPYNKEMLSTPYKMLRDIDTHGMAHGDCDDLSTFLATMISSIGVRPRFRFGGNHEQGIHHVWVQAEIDGKWYDLDPSLGKPMGRYHRFQIYEVEEIWD